MCVVRFVVALGFLGQTEINQFGLRVRSRGEIAQHDVFGLDVAVHNWVLACVQIV